MPITTLDGAPVGNGEVGPVTGTLWKACRDAHADPSLSLPVKDR